MAFPLALMCLATMSAAEDYDPIAIEALQSRLQIWVDNLDFKCSYKFYVFNSNDLVEASAGNRVGNERPPLFSGNMARRGNLFRVSKTYATQAVLINEDKISRRKFYRCANSDFLSNGTVWLGYTPRQINGAISGSASAQEISGISPFPVVVSPCNPLGRRSDKMEILPSEYRSKPYQVKAYSRPNNAIEIIMKHSNIENTLMTIILSLDYVYPVPICIRYRDGDYSQTCTLSQYTKCGKSIAPKMIVNAGKLNSDKLYYVTQWVAEDIGKGTPELKDFVLQLDEKDSLIGLKGVPRFGEGRKLDIATFSTKDLGIYTTSKSNLLSYQNNKLYMNLKIILLANLMSIAAMVAIAFVYRYIKNKIKR